MLRLLKFISMENEKRFPVKIIYSHYASIFLLATVHNYKHSLCFKLLSRIVLIHWIESRSHKKKTLIMTLRNVSSLSERFCTLWANLLMSQNEYSSSYSLQISDNEQIEKVYLCNVWVRRFVLWIKTEWNRKK